MEIPSTRPINAPAAVAVQPEKAPEVAPVPQPEAASPAAPPQVETVPVSKLLQTREAIAEQVSRYLQTSARNLEFQVDGDSATPVIIVRDGEGNVVRRIPGEVALQMLRLANAQSGTFVDSTA